MKKCRQEGNLPPEVIMQHPSVCDSCVPIRHVREVFFASTDAFFGVFVSQIASSNHQHQTALSYNKNSEVCLPSLLSNPILLHLSASCCPENPGKPLPSVLQVHFLSCGCFGPPPCQALVHTHALSTQTVLLRVLLGLSLVRQTQLGWQEDQVSLETALASLLRWRDVTHAEDSLSGCFLLFRWVGVDSCTGSL